MADAILQAAPQVETPNVLVVWGDQALLRANTVRACAWVHEHRAGACLTLPTSERAHPYISIERDGAGRIVAVRQAREAEVHVDRGESDCGLFLFSTAALFGTLRAAAAEGAARGAATGEFNLLPLLPRFEQGRGAVVSVRVSDPTEALGINTIEDVAVAERVLRARQPDGSPA